MEALALAYALFAAFFVTFFALIVVESWRQKNGGFSLALGLIVALALGAAWPWTLWVGFHRQNEEED